MASSKRSFQQTSVERTTLFEAIPRDALSVLLQYLSDRPHSEDWLNTVELKDALTVLTSDGALSTAGRHHFKDLKTITKYDRLPDELRDEFCSFVNIMAPYAESLSVQSPILGALNCNRFSALRVLSIHNCSDLNAMENVFGACGDNLRELSLMNMSLEQKMIRIIARYCEAVEVLGLFEINYEGTLDRIWVAVGGNLRELDGNIEEKEFVHIALHCTKLEKLQLRGMYGVWGSTSIIELLRRLQTVRVLNIDLSASDLDSKIQNLRTLLAVCPSDMKICSKMVFYCNNDCFDYIREIGHRLQKLELLCGFGSFPSDVLRLLVNMEHLSLFQSLGLEHLSALESVFARRMPNLRKLVILGHISTKMMSALARATSSLIDFEYHAKIPFRRELQELPVKASDFTDFLEANRHLERIRIEFNIPYVVFFAGSDDDDDSMDRLQGLLLNELSSLITMLRFHTKLREVVLKSMYTSGELSQNISNACVLLRNKGLNVVVDNIRYLPPP